MGRSGAGETCVVELHSDGVVYWNWCCGAEWRYVAALSSVEVFNVTTVLCFRDALCNCA